MKSEYTLCFPFELSEGKKFILSKIDSEKTNVANLFFEIKYESPIYIIKFYGFKSEAEAKKFLISLYAGFLWMMLNMETTFKAKLECQKIDYFDDPIKTAVNISKSFGGIKTYNKLDALIHRDTPAIYLSEKDVRKISINSPTIKIGRNWGNCFNFIKQATFSEKSSELINDKKLFLSLELYRAHFFEISINAKLLVLVTALEVLLKDQKRPKIILGLLKGWKKEVNILLKDSKKADDKKALKNIKNELITKEEKSISAKIREYIKNVFIEEPEKIEKYTKDSIKIYDIRCRLIHSGESLDKEINWAENRIKEIMKDILKINFSKFVGIIKK